MNGAKPDFTLITETGLNRNIDKDIINEEGNDNIKWTEQTAHSNKHGVAILSRTPCGRRMHNMCCKWKHHFLWMVTNFKNCAVHKIVVYCPPNDEATQSQLVVRISQAIHTILSSGQKVILAGDFNKSFMPIIKSMAQKCGLYQLLHDDTPTRMPRGDQDHAPSQLDQIFHNFQDARVSRKWDSSFSDHCVLSVTFTDNAATQFPPHLTPEQKLQCPISSVVPITKGQIEALTTTREARKFLLENPDVMFDGEKHKAFIQEQWGKGGT